jgi:hypothetical protein
VQNAHALATSIHIQADQIAGLRIVTCIIDVIWFKSAYTNSNEMSINRLNSNLNGFYINSTLYWC